ANYAGTLSVRDGSFRRYINDICSSVVSSGFDGLVIVSGHASADHSLRETGFWCVNSQFREGKVTCPVMVSGIYEETALIEREMGLKAGKHADWRELLLLYKVLGGDFFTKEKLEAIKEFGRSGEFLSLNYRVLGIPMEHRSLDGVLGDPVPEEGVDWGEASDRLWGLVVRSMRDTIEGELDKFWSMARDLDK
ncbi:MAG: creatininase family protein, partial [Nitrospirota bacterium]